MVEDEPEGQVTVRGKGLECPLKVGQQKCFKGKGVSIRAIFKEMNWVVE